MKLYLRAFIHLNVQFRLRCRTLHDELRRDEERDGTTGERKRERVRAEREIRTKFVPSRLAIDATRNAHFCFPSNKDKSGTRTERYPWSKLSTETKCKTRSRFPSSCPLFLIPFLPPHPPTIHGTLERIVEVPSSARLHALVVASFLLVILVSLSLSLYIYTYICIYFCFLFSVPTLEPYRNYIITTGSFSTFAR